MNKHVKIAGNSMVAAPTHFKLNRSAEVQKKSLTEEAVKVI